MSAEAVRQAIGAWAYTLGAAARRPTGEAVRAAVGVACAVRELALELECGPGQGSAASPDPTRPVPLDYTALGDRAGLAPRDADAAVALLAAGSAATVQQGSGGATVALSPSILAPLPTVARLAWTGIRHRLEQVGASVAPALAVLRELAAQLGALGDDAIVPSLRASVRDLEDATGFGRSTVSAALEALDRARLLDVETRAGRTTRFLLRPAAFGRPDEAPRPREEAAPLEHPISAPGPIGTVAVPLQPLGQSGTGSGRATTSAGASVPPVAPGSATAPTPAASDAPVVLIGTFAGTPIYAPQGTPLVVECDQEGRWSCRVGPFLRLGPVAPSD